jgi:hypothetical protein
VVAASVSWPRCGGGTGGSWMWQWGEGSGGGVGNMVWWCQTFLFFLKNICHVYNLAHDEATLTSSGTVIFVFTFFAVCQKKLIAKRFTACAKKRHTQTFLHHASICRVMFVVCIRDLQTAISLSCVLRASLCARGIRRSCRFR